MLTSPSGVIQISFNWKPVYNSATWTISLTSVRALWGCSEMTHRYTQFFCLLHSGLTKFALKLNTTLMSERETVRQVYAVSENRGSSFKREHQYAYWYKSRTAVWGEMHVVLTFQKLLGFLLYVPWDVAWLTLFKHGEGAAVILQ